jgi:NTP pyrophosphatase (non-canonical NTP hydrolase)
MVNALCKSGSVIKEEMTSEEAHLVHMAIGISGETGELLDIVKKSVVYRKDLDIQHVIEELGDIEFYLEGFRQGVGLDREEILQNNMNKLGVRYSGFKYSNENAKDRKDKS